MEDTGENQMGGEAPKVKPEGGDAVMSIKVKDQTGGEVGAACASSWCHPEAPVWSLWRLSCPPAACKHAKSTQRGLGVLVCRSRRAMQPGAPVALTPAPPP